jgi:hypothetical protein
MTKFSYRQKRKEKEKEKENLAAGSCKLKVWCYL